jgi:small GTP-binding protein
MSKRTIALLGNPNCGKTTLFNALTGARQRVGNWAGVTVERKEGIYRDQGQTVTVVDLPGIYSLDVAAGGTGLDEQVARDYLLSGEANLVVNILDASNLERNLYLTTQLLEMGVPLVLALNMMDQAAGRGMRIDLAGLQRRLGCPVVPLCAHRGRGVAELQEVIRQALTQPQGAGVRPVYPPVIEQAFTELSHTAGLGSPWAVLYGLQAVDGANVAPVLETHRQEIFQTLGEDIDLLVADVRYTWIREVVAATVTFAGQVSQTLSDRIDRWVLHRWLGIPIFLGVMYLMFFVAMNVGGAFVDFFDIGVGTIAVKGTAHLLTQLHAPGWLIGLLADGVGGGIQTTATFIPQIGLLFLLLAVLEDSGLFGAGGVCDGPADAVDRLAGEVLCADAGGVWVQYPRHYGDPYLGKSTGPVDDDSDEPVYVLRGAAVRVCPVWGGVFSEKCPKCGVSALPDWHWGGGVYGFGDEKHPATGDSGSLHYGIAALPFAHAQGGSHPRLGTVASVYYQSGADDYRDGDDFGLVKFGGNGWFLWETGQYRFPAQCGWAADYAGICTDGGATGELARNGGDIYRDVCQGGDGGDDEFPLWAVGAGGSGR